MESLKKIRNSIVYILLLLALIVCYPNISKADYNDVIDSVANSKQSNEFNTVNWGGRLFSSYTVLKQRKDLYCIEHSGKLSSSPRYFHITNFIKIEGNTAINTKGQTVEDERNGVLAYVIAQKQGYGSSAGNYTQGQKAIYHLIYDWVYNVGSKLGVSKTLYNYDGSKEYPANSLVTQGKAYAQSIKNVTNQEEVSAKDNTDKSKIKVTQIGTNLRVGPFNWTFSGTLDSFTVKADGEKQIAVYLTKFVGDKEVNISLSDVKSGEDFYIVFPIQDGVTKIVNVSGVAKVKETQTQQINAYLWFMEPRTNTDSGPAHAYQNLLLTNSDQVSVKNVEIPVGSDYDINLVGPLGILKVDADDTSKTLSGIGFIIQKATGEYVKNQNGVISYVSDRSQATTFLTDSKGKIGIEGLLIGNYTVEEVVNPYEDYEIEEVKNVTITVKPSTTINYTMITNRREYIKLSGYVWLDTRNEKMTVRNDLYMDNEYDNTDELVSGVIVRLKSRTTGEVIKNPCTEAEQVTKTGSDGKYSFEKVVIDNLSDYYVEFEYDGYVYSNVQTYLDKTNGSKASEGTARKEFDDKFATIEAKEGTDDVVLVKDANGNVQYEVNYDRNLEEGKSTVRSGQSFPILANTQNANYVFTYERGSSATEIENINLGLYVRSHTDLALMQDMDQIKVGINGYEHIYKYSSRFNNDQPSEDSWNVGVKFRGEYGQMSYSRAIYKADAEYDNGPDESKLQVSITYKIGVKNESSIYAKVNSINNYFDNRYTLKAVGLGVNEEGNITDELKTSDVTVEGDKYNKVEIAAGLVLKPAEVKYIYIQFSLSRENVLNLLNTDVERPNLENISEINSYTSYYDENATQLYSSVDVDSVPENITAGDKTTYEDDTDAAPDVKLVIANARQISGTIFEDEADEATLNDKNIRQGDAKYDEANENKIGGVTVQLVHVNDAGEATDEIVEVYDEREGADGKEIGWTGAKCETTSDSDGNYTISGYIPGKYAIKYIWGDGTYKIVNGTQELLEDVVENYKGTAIDKSRYDSETTNKQFYKDNEEIRQSHAIDNYTTRQEIDKQLNENGYNYTTEVTTRQMTSTTPQMEFMVEYTDTDIDSITFDRITKHVAFEVKNIDFGIIRRPVQSVNFVKSLSKIKITLANGQVLIDADIDQNGNMTGETNYLTYVGPVKENGITVSNGFLKAELDSELIQGATVQMEYKLRTENTSEADYMSEGFYKYGEGWYNLVSDGETQKENDVVTITPSKIVDYLDEKSIYKVGDEVNEKYQWKQMSVEDLKTSGLVVSNVTDALQTGKYTDENGVEQEINPVQIYTTEYLNTTKLKPVRQVNNVKKDAEGGDVYMVVNKVLSSEEDANFENQAELVLLDKPGGSKPTPTPGNYIPNSQNQETDDSTSEQIIITPSTGADENYILPITIGVVALVILGAGIVLIKKKVL